MKILSVVGARPNFMKVAPILSAIQECNERVRATAPTRPDPAHSEEIQHVLVHTGQHYDQAMSDSFFTDLGLPQPDVHLGVGSGSHAAQTAEIMKRFEEVLLRERPDVVIVVGDVNSTLGCALVTAKISFDANGTRPLIAHVEAGLRSFDRTMPEEYNRLLTDHLSDLLFVTEESGLRNLKAEGIPEGKVFFVGNTMIDSLLAFRDRADESPILSDLGLRGPSRNGARNRAQPYALLTLHRPSNVDDAEAFQNILEGLSPLSRQMEIIFPVHPRTRKRIQEFALERHFQMSPNGDQKGIRLIHPLGYLDFLSLMKNAGLVLTDSGGIQEETSCLRVPCVTLRETTERPVTVTHGPNVVAGISVEGIGKAIVRQMSRKARTRLPRKWDGRAAQRIVQVLANAVREPRA
ncbi:MAG: non-hydrolyzing UDP-N-acetylglucosamine 2-epimerase [Candidatus Acidiferrales bacterium]